MHRRKEKIKLVLFQKISELFVLYSISYIIFKVKINIAIAANYVT